MTQLDIIKEKLNTDREVSRNWCLQRFISRLGSRIQDLEEKGWKFRTEHRKGDYVYILTQETPIRAELPSQKVSAVVEKFLNTDFYQNKTICQNPTLF